MWKAQVTETKALEEEGANMSITQPRENLPDSPLGLRFLQSLRSIVDRILDLIETNGAGRNHGQTSVELLRHALSMESSFAVWYWRRAHLDGAGPEMKARLKERAQNAMEDADLIAECLHRITGSTDLIVEWDPSVKDPEDPNGPLFRNTISDDIIAEGISLECYTNLGAYFIGTSDKRLAASLDRMVTTRKQRLWALLRAIDHPVLAWESSSSSRRR